MGDQYCLEELGGEEEKGDNFEDDLDAFNDETFGGAGLGDAWQEGDHEQLAEMTEKEKAALVSSSQFFGFGSDGELEGEELGGELEEGLGLQDDKREGIAKEIGQMSLKEDKVLPLAGVGPPPIQQLNLPKHLQHQQGGPGVPVYLQPQVGGNLYFQQQQPQQHQFPLLPPSHFGESIPSMPGMMPGLAKLPPPPIQHPHPGFPVLPGLGVGVPPPPHPGLVPGMKTLADLEAEMLYGPRQAVAPQPQPHMNPALHNLSYPGMRDRQGPVLPRHQIQQQQQQHRQSPVQRQQQHFFQGQQHQHDQGAPAYTRDINYNDHKRGNHQRFDQHQFQHQQQPPPHHQQHQHHQFQQDKRNSYFKERGPGPGPGSGSPRRDNGFNHRPRRDSWRNEKNNHYDNANRHNRHTFGEYFDQSARRDLMPGHVHTLGILRHSRSRHERERSEEGGLEDCLEDGTSVLLDNPTGDPLLDAKMAEEQAEMAKKRAHYANSEDEYAGLMSQKDKQWIINIQLNQLKCDNPYVDDYYYTMFQHKKESSSTEDPKAGGQLIKSVSESAGPSQGYKPTQFENSLGKLQVVTVKAPRQIIDVGVVRGGVESPVGNAGQGLEESFSRRVEVKGVLLGIEQLYLSLLDLECDHLKLGALPLGTALREQVRQEAHHHLNSLETGLSHSSWLVDCLAVSKGRTLLLRCLPFLGADGGLRSALLDLLLSHLHLLARDPGAQEGGWQKVLESHIQTQAVGSLEQCTRSLLCLKPKLLQPLLSSRLGASVALSLLTRAVKEQEGQGWEEGSTWGRLASALLLSQPHSSLPLDREHLASLQSILQGQEKHQEWTQWLDSVAQNGSS